MNPLEQYIEPDWKITRLSERQKVEYGFPADDNWVIVNYKTNCYGNISKIHRPWLLSEWEEAIKRGYYME